MVTTPLAKVLAGIRLAGQRYGRPPAAKLPDLVVTITPDTRAFRLAIEDAVPRIDTRRPPTLEEFHETGRRLRHEAAIHREWVRAWQWQTAAFEAAWARYGWERPPRPEVGE